MIAVNIFIYSFLFLLFVYVFCFLFPNYLGQCEKITKMADKELNEAWESWRDYQVVPFIYFQRNRNIMATKIKEQRRIARLKKLQKELRK